MSSEQKRLSKRQVLRLLTDLHDGWLDKFRHPFNDAQFQLANGRIGAYHAAIEIVKQMASPKRKKRISRRAARTKK